MHDAGTAVSAEPCPNCGNSTPGNYCPECGQRRGERWITLRRMLAEVIEDQLSLNAALPRTLRALLFHPGFLSAEYLAGRIQRYIPPFRLYLATSVVFFLLLSFLGERGRGVVRIESDGAIADSTLTVLELIERADTTPTGERRMRQLAPFNTPWEWLDSLGNSRFRELLDQRPREAARAFTNVFLRRVPTTVFLLLPLFAFLLYLLFFRRRRYYVEHFVFALHTHAFVFALFTLLLPFGGIPWIAVPLFLLMLLYGYVALKRFYGQGWFLTLLKYGMFGVVYSMVFGVGFLITMLVTLLLD
jgi:hypothetical protein